jgi:cobalt-zinc-cadmium efflux system membrane fusion protein
MKKYIYILVLTAFAIGVSSCKNDSKTENETLEENHSDEGILISNEQFDHNKMELGSVSDQSFPALIKTTGIIDVPPQSKEVISSFFGGYIKNSTLLIGDKVRKGQAVATLENPEFIEFQQEYLEISEQLTFLKSEYNRQKTLFEEKITSQKNYLKAQSEYNRKLAMYNGLKKKLQMLNINPSSVEQGKITSEITLYSSISGSVTSVNVSKGTYISPADVIMEIVNKDHIHIELTVFEKDVLSIKVHQKITFSIPEASDKIYDAEVHLVGTQIDTDTRTIKVHGHLEDDKNNIFAIGMFVDAAIEISNKTEMALPNEAIVQEDDKFVILVLKSKNDKGYVFEEKNITIGNKYNGFTEVMIENISTSDKILIKGAFDLVGVSEGGHSH